MARSETEIEERGDDFYVVTDVEALAKLQGVKPLDFARMRHLGKFWPKDESIDDFIATVRRWRDEEGVDAPTDK
jgi:hypothetical protein